MAAAAADDPRLDLVGYARLVGDGMDYVVRKYEVILGRASKSSNTDVVLGENMNISRQHAKIVYNFATKAFELSVMGKNGVTVGTTLYTPASAPCALKSQDMLAVGDKVFHFLLPKPTDRITKRDLDQLAPQAAAHKRQKLQQDAALGLPTAASFGGGLPALPLAAAAALPRGPPGMPPQPQVGLINAVTQQARPVLPPGATSSQQATFILQQHVLQQQQAAAAAALAAAQGAAGANGTLGAGQ